MPSSDDVGRRTGANIRAARKARGYGLDDFAALAGVSRSCLWRLETGHQAITLDRLDQVAKALRTTAVALIAKPRGRGRR